MNNAQEMEDEINFIDIVRVILKRRVLIVAGILLCLAVAVVYSLSLPKVYKLSSVAEIGMIGGKKIDSIKSFKSKVLMDYSYLVMQEMNISERAFPEINIENPDDSSFIEIWINMADREKGKNILQQIEVKFEQDHKRQTTKARTRLQNEIKRLDRHISELDFSSKKITNNLEKMRQSIDTANITLNTAIAAKVWELQSSVTQIKLKKMLKEDEKIAIQYRLADIQETRVLKSPSASAGPIAPNKKLIVILGGLVGMIMSVFLVFFLEFIENYKNQMEKLKA